VVGVLFNTSRADDRFLSSAIRRARKADHEKRWSALQSTVLLLFMQPLPIIDGFGHGRNRAGRNQDQVESHCLRFADSNSRGHDFDGAVGKDCTNFGSTNTIINILHEP
jgi:hypothetical protein